MDFVVYVNVIRNNFINFACNKLPLDFIFQQDNDPKHKSNIAKRWVIENGFTVIDWPLYSPN